ncbi:hypothetical protein FC15_GL000129 [Lapidilactobacillus concavus DSM 17758]|uniref:HTH tetR-type domain-containing protein n=1 Tax=Lapidilactobacillus concavus DSM 17758 TaxID=1423735 RepID=A0A0R1W585_9LACO|nr:TetR family transcriptional regulator [Lapidilactobacillus concavus]KRM12929.1 hypothetical protein FC15_GL000129 [Lapidilactobacillus concavus DSM 17758]GEL13182.1 TetR family transcriptional regulator [Lapidilactobacillus concavus]
MPSQTFLSLPLEKQKKIMAAARQAFSDASYTEVTITDIIQLAEIPRGSFYQYFKDKEDIYFYVLQSYRDLFKNDLLDHLTEQQGDLFAAIRATYADVIDYLSQGVDHRLLQNIFMEMDYRGYQHLLKREVPRHHHQDWSAWQQEIKKRTDLTRLRIEDDRFDLLLHMLLGFMGQSMARYFIRHHEEMHEGQLIQSQRTFDELLNWFEYGVLKETTGRELND